MQKSASDKDGIPLGHEVWPGNMSDKPAFKAVIEKIKTKFEIEKVILVADRGMISEDNLDFLEKNNYEYILGVKMRQLSGIRQKLLLNNEGFLAISSGLKAKQMNEYELWEKEIEKQNEKRKTPKILTEQEKDNYKNSKKGKRRWVVCLNEAVASIDKEKREYFQRIIENKIEFSTAKEWIVKNGYKKYVNISDFKIELNAEKLRDDEFYDGKWALITNTELAKTELVNTYKDLASIERHFRDLKTELEVGPIYHYTEKRIRAHIFVCFLALQLKVAMMVRLKPFTEMGFSETMRHLARIQAVKYETKGEESLIRTDMSEEVKLVFNAIGANIPSKIIR